MESNQIAQRLVFSRGIRTFQARDLEKLFSLYRFFQQTQVSNLYQFEN